MKKLSLWIYFIPAALFLFLGTALLPLVKVWPFTPFLAALFYRVTFSKALWISFFCGLAMDIFSSQFKLGILSLIHVFTCLILYTQKKHFFEEKATAVSLYSALISCFLSLFLILFSALEKQITITSSLLFSDLFIMPILDGVYAFIVFALPSYFYFILKKYIIRRQLDLEDA